VGSEKANCNPKVKVQDFVFVLRNELEFPYNLGFLYFLIHFEKRDQKEREK
jgi:hypothetical protein